MDGKALVRAALAFQETSPVPYHFDLTSRVATRILDAMGNTDPSADIEALIGNSLYGMGVRVPEGALLYDEVRQTKTDEFGIVWQADDKLLDIGEHGHILDHPIKGESLAGYRFPDPRLPGRFDGIAACTRDHADRFCYIDLLGLFDLCWRARGMEQFLVDMVENPALCDELLEEALGFNLGLLDQCRDLGLDGVRFIEDWGQQHGLIMGERLWVRYLKPRLRQMYAATKRAGLVVLIHSCGDIRALFPHLIEIAVDVVNPIQPEVMDIGAIKLEYGHDLVLYGGVGAQSLLVHGTPDLVRTETRRSRELMRRGGGYIFGNAGAFATDTPVDNVMALLEVAREP